MSDLNINQNSSSTANQPSIDSQAGIQTGSQYPTLSPGDSLLRDTLLTVEVLKKEVEELKVEQKKTSDFYKSSTSLSKTVKWIIIILMIVPLFQVIACAVVVYYLGIQDQISSLLNWVLGGITLLSALEVIIGAIKISFFDNRISELEKKNK